MTFTPFSGSFIHRSTVVWNQHRSVYSPHFYDQNFIEFKLSPSFEEFIETESFQKHTNQSDALTFKFPPNTLPYRKVDIYLERHHYEKLTLNVYKKEASLNQPIVLSKRYRLEQVTQENEHDYLKYQYQQDLYLGDTFANANQLMLKDLLNSNKLMSFIIYYDHQIIARAEYIIHPKSIELYYIEVEMKHRRKALATYLQQAMKQHYPHATFYAVADAQDEGANQMYQSLGYQVDYWFLQCQKVTK